MHAHMLANQVVAPHRGCRRGRDTRRRCVVVAAAADEAMDLCRDKVSSPKDLKGESGTTCIVNFKGADGRVLPVEMPEVADLSFVLEQDQVDQGFALLCMSRPVPGEEVTIEAQCDWGNVSMSNWKGATFFTGEPVPLWKDDVKGLRG